jgi:superfamily II DNA or RNA helicase
LESKERTVRIAVDARLRLNRDRLDPETVTALRAMFTKDNPKFFQVKRMGFSTWKTPAKITSYRTEDNVLSFPRGALERVVGLLEARGYAIDTIHDRSLKLERINLELAHPLYPYQQAAVDSVVRSGNCVFRGPCGSGKTIVLIGIIAALKQPTLVIVHTEALKKQWEAVVGEWLGIVPGSLGGKGGKSIRPVTIGMQQTIWKSAKSNPEWARQFGCIVGDEVHHWAAKTFQLTADMFPAAYRIGASADEKRKDGLEFLIYDTFGPCVHEIRRENLVELDQILPVEMLVVKTGYANDSFLMDKEAEIPANWGRLLNELITDEERNALILSVVMRLLGENKTNRLLILTERVQACRDWQEILGSHGVACGVMVGGAENRNDMDAAIAELRSGRIRVAVGTKVADEGLDIKPLTHVLITCPQHQHPKRLEQMTGRAARTCEGKSRAVAIYFWDELTFPPPSDNYAIDRAKRKRIFRDLSKACSTLTGWDPATNKTYKLS